MNHHPALADAGELEIAQRAALEEAYVAGTLTGNSDRHGSEEIARAAIDAYLTAMRRAWSPEALEIGEGDFVVLDVAGERLEVHADVVRERDVQVDKSRRWPEYPRATIRGNGHFYEDDGATRVEIDGLQVFLGD